MSKSAKEVVSGSFEILDLSKKKASSKLTKDIRYKEDGKDSADPPKKMLGSERVKRRFVEVYENNPKTDNPIWGIRHVVITDKNRVFSNQSMLESSSSRGGKTKKWSLFHEGWAPGFDATRYFGRAGLRPVEKKDAKLTKKLLNNWLKTGHTFATNVARVKKLTRTGKPSR